MLPGSSKPASRESPSLLPIVSVICIVVLLATALVFFRATHDLNNYRNARKSPATNPVVAGEHR